MGVNSSVRSVVLNRLADEFAARYRQSQQPSLRRRGRV
jgi:hypothetical protein